MTAPEDATRGGQTDGQRGESAPARGIRFKSMRRSADGGYKGDIYMCVYMYACMCVYILLRARCR